MNESEALMKMVAPGTPRPGAYRQGIIQIWTTRACDKACYGCTQGSNLRGHRGFISLEHFEQACISLKDYFGVVGVFGGNPALHPRFPAICEILRRQIPFERRGLWCNHPRGHADVMRMTFNPSVSNLNVHLDQDAYNEFKQGWPECNPVGLHGDSRHSPPFVALQDVLHEESDRWDLIADCDINRHWSAMICEFRGNLRAYFCEVAGAQAIMHDEPDYPDLGMRVVPGWWKLSMTDFAAQVRYHCHACGIPLRIRGELSQAESGKEQVSKTHYLQYVTKKSNREVELVRDLVQIECAVPKVIDYLGNAKR